MDTCCICGEKTDGRYCVGNDKTKLFVYIGEKNKAHFECYVKECVKDFHYTQVIEEDIK